MTEDKEQEIVRYLIEYKYDIEEVVEEFQISESTLYKIIRKHGIQIVRRTKFDEMSSVDQDLLVDMYEGGKTWNMIEARFNLSLGVLRNILFNKLGVVPIAMRKDVIMGGRSMMEQALEMYRHGWVLWFINEATGIGVPTIIREAQKRGRDRGTGNKGKVPAVDPKTREYLIKPDGTWLSVRERDNLKKTALGRKLTVDEVAVLKGIGM